MKPVFFGNNKEKNLDFLISWNYLSKAYPLNRIITYLKLCDLDKDKEYMISYFKKMRKEFNYLYKYNPSEDEDIEISVLNQRGEPRSWESAFVNRKKKERYIKSNPSSCSVCSDPLNKDNKSKDDRCKTCFEKKLQPYYCEVCGVDTPVRFYKTRRNKCMSCIRQNFLSPEPLYCFTNYKPTTEIDYGYGGYILLNPSFSNSKKILQCLYEMKYTGLSNDLYDDCYKKIKSGTGLKQYFFYLTYKYKEDKERLKKINSFQEELELRYILYRQEYKDDIYFYDNKYYKEWKDNLYDNPEYDYYVDDNVDKYNKQISNEKTVSIRQPIQDTVFLELEKRIKDYRLSINLTKKLNNEVEKHKIQFDNRKIEYRELIKHKLDSLYEKKISDYKFMALEGVECFLIQTGKCESPYTPNFDDLPNQKITPYDKEYYSPLFQSFLKKHSKWKTKQIMKKYLLLVNEYLEIKQEIENIDYVSDVVYGDGEEFIEDTDLSFGGFGYSGDGFDKSFDEDDVASDIRIEKKWEIEQEKIEYEKLRQEDEYDRRQQEEYNEEVEMLKNAQKDLNDKIKELFGIDFDSEVYFGNDIDEYVRWICPGFDEEEIDFVINADPSFDNLTIEDRLECLLINMDIKDHIKYDPPF